MKHFLATTGISEFWDIDSHIFFLGPWCLIGKRNRESLSGKSYGFVPSPWNSNIKIKKASDYCHRVYEEILPGLCDELNRIHNISRPERYWRVLLGPWLLHYIEIIYDRYTRIENAYTLFPDLCTYILPEDSCGISLSDTSDLLSACGKAADDYYNLKLFSIIIRYLYPAQAAEKNITIPAPSRNTNKSARFFKNIFYGIKGMRDSLIFPKVILSDMHQLSPMQILSLESGSYPNRVVFKNFNNAKKSSRIDACTERLRRKIELKDKPDKFYNLLTVLIPDAIPECYVESYKRYTDRVRADKVRAIGSASGWYFNEEFKFYAAEAASSGAKLLEFQFGGGYGMALSYPAEYISYEKDIFYSWGRNTDRQKARILSSPYLSNLLNKHSARSGQILFIGTSMPAYVYRFQSVLFPEDMFKYNEDKKNFLKALSAEVKNEVIYRPYPHDYGWQEKMTVQEALPQISFSQKGKAVEWMKRAKLAVIDHPHTGFLEALTINVPSVFYWDHDVFAVIPEAEEYFELLRKAGILHRDPLSAANKVNQIFADPMGWWSGKEVQDARSKFCEHFAYARESWTDEWSRELNNIASTQ